jgi:thymidylate synthase
MLKPVFISARDLPDAWYQCVSTILDEGHIYEITKGSYEGQKRWEFDHITVHIKHPGNKPLVPDMPPGMTMPPPTSMEYVEQYLPYLMTNERQEKETYTYGERLIGRKDADNDELCVRTNQVEKVIEMFKEAGEGTNQATMEIGMPDDCGEIDPPCLRIIDCRLRYGALHFILYFRSWDLWGAFSANLAAIQLLKEYMAAEIGCEDGEIVANSKGLHIYDYSWDLAKLRTYKSK